MSATILAFRTEPNSPDYTEPQIARDWHDVIQSAASDAREEITRIRRARALIATIEQWGDPKFSDITDELRNLVIEPAEDEIREHLRRTASATCDERDEFEIDELVDGTKIVEIMRAWPYRRPSPLNFLIVGDYEKVWHAEVLTGLPLAPETVANKGAAQ